MIFFKNKSDPKSIIEETILDMRKHFSEILDKNKNITSKDVMSYLKLKNASFGMFHEKITSKTKQFDFSLDKDQPALKHFLFHIYLNYLPEYFSIEIMGNDKFTGFLLNYESNKEKIEVRCKYINSGIPDKPTKNAETLMKKLIKEELFVKDSYYD